MNAIIGNLELPTVSEDLSDGRR